MWPSLEYSCCPQVAQPKLEESDALGSSVCFANIFQVVSKGFSLISTVYSFSTLDFLSTCS